MKPGAVTEQNREQRTQAAPISREMQSKARGTKHRARSMQLEAYNRRHEDSS